MATDSPYRGPIRDLIKWALGENPEEPYSFVGELRGLFDKDGKTGYWRQAMQCYTDMCKELGLTDESGNLRNSIETPINKNVGIDLAQRVRNIAPFYLMMAMADMS